MAIWMLREGTNDEYLNDSLENNYVAIGWAEFRNKTKLKESSHDTIYQLMQETYADRSNQTLGSYASQVHSFANKLYGGDFLVVPSGGGAFINIAYIISDINENPSNETYLATREVVWLIKNGDRGRFEKSVSKPDTLAAPRTLVETSIGISEIETFVKENSTKTVWELLIEAGVNVWIFQSNPARWNLLAALEHNVNHDWAANKNKDNMKSGDLIFFRQSDPESGIYAFGHLMKEPFIRDENEFGDWGVIVGFDYKIIDPLKKNEIKTNPQLASISVINGLQGTNFRLPNDSALFLIDFVEDRLQQINSIDIVPNYWWCNVGITSKADLETGTIWAPAVTANGSVLSHHINVTKIKRGDIILHYATGKGIVAYSICSEESTPAPRPPGYEGTNSAANEGNWPREGNLVKADFLPFDPPVPISSLSVDLKTLGQGDGPFDKNLDVKQGYLWPLSTEFFDEFLEQFPIEISSQRRKQMPAEIVNSLDVLARELFVPTSWLQEVIGQITDSKQSIFYGPPGTGKTFIARAISRHLTKAENIEIVQFHPSFSYEDFFEGFRPSEASGSGINLEKVAGPLKRIAQKARENTTETFILIIDEINRGNLAKVFGELYYLLEYRNDEISLMYSKEEKFSLPENLLFIGTMNTSDRSIALVDSAIRRRFRFIHLDPSETPCDEILGGWLKANSLPDTSSRILKKLNSELAKNDLSIGPAYFMKTRDQSEKSLKLIWKYSIEPLLEEFFYGNWIEKKQQFSFENFI